MDQIFLHLVLNYVLPAAFSAISVGITAWAPFVIKYINRYLKNKLQIQQDVINTQTEQKLIDEAKKVVSYVEEMSRRKVNDSLSTANPLTSSEKLNLAQQMLTQATGVDLTQANKLIHTVLSDSRESKPTIEYTVLNNKEADK